MRSSSASRDRLILGVVATISIATTAWAKRGDTIKKVSVLEQGTQAEQDLAEELCNAVDCIQGFLAVRRCGQDDKPGFWIGPTADARQCGFGTSKSGSYNARTKDLWVSSDVLNGPNPYFVKSVVFEEVFHKSQPHDLRPRAAANRLEFDINVSLGQATSACIEAEAKLAGFVNIALLPNGTGDPQDSENDAKLRGKALDELAAEYNSYIKFWCKLENALNGVAANMNQAQTNRHHLLKQKKKFLHEVLQPILDTGNRIPD